MYMKLGYFLAKNMNLLRHWTILASLSKVHMPLKKPIFSNNGNSFNKAKAFLFASASVGAYVMVDDVDTFPSYIWASIRFLRSLKIGITISLDYYFSTMGLNEQLDNYKPMMSLIHKRAATQILEGCLINGGTYIKLGQGLVSLSHILPKEYIEILTRLQDRCKQHDISDMFQIIEEDFCKRPSDFFRSLDYEPIAAASLAQVFKGETIDGDKVAIKVQYIDLQSRFISDVATIEFLLKIIGFMHPDFNFGWVLTDLSSNLREELDFLKEGRNSERCAEDLKEFDFVHVPKVYWEYCSSRILVTEFIDAIKVNEVHRLKNEGFSFADIDLKISEIFGHQIFKSGFVHADPHPGNLLIRKKNNEAEIVLLDHGLYQELDDCTRTALRGMWSAIVFKNYKEMEFYADLLGVKNCEVLAEILTQRPVKAKGFKLTSRITDEQLRYLQEAARNRFDQIMEVLKVMPRSLLLVVRNLNTIRSITHDHGDPIDRYAALARCASNSSNFQPTTFRQKVYAFIRNWYFEFKLLTGKLWVWCIKGYLKMLTTLGRSPDTSMLVADLS